MWIVTFQNRGPSTPEAVFPEGHPFQPGTVHAGTCFPGRSPLPTGDRPHQRPFLRTVNVWSGAGRHKATCHPRLGGACEANGLVRIAQAGVAGAAPARDVKKACSATPTSPPRDVKKACSATPTSPPRDAKKAGTTAAGRPGAAATARPGCGELNPKGSPPRPAVAGRVSVGAGGRLRRGGWRRRR